jgi:hypothetical protein
MTDLALIQKLGEAMAVAVELRDTGAGYRAVRLVDAINTCIEHVTRDDLAAADIEFRSMSYQELEDWYQARLS